MNQQPTIDRTLEVSENIALLFESIIMCDKRVVEDTALLGRGMALLSNLKDFSRTIKNITNKMPPNIR